MERVDAIIIGAGVVGLAIARALADAGREVLIVERADAIGTETSSRNSEVIHAGLYYPPGSLKARLCLRGRDLLYDYAANRGVPHRRCGKLIVATDPAQDIALRAIRDRATDCGVTGLSLISGHEARAIEPALAATAALFSPETGIVDSHALMLALSGDAQAGGAMLALNTAFVAARPDGRGWRVESRDRASGEGFAMRCDWLVNAAGLWASDVGGAIAGLRNVPRTRYARGNYYAAAGRATFSRLIYPVPEPGGLGVHLTLDLAGGMRFGPDVDWIEAVDYRVNDTRRAHFEAAIRRYWPGLPDDALAPAYCGIRPKLSGPGEAAADFRIDGPGAHGLAGLVALYGIESPGLTASLAIAEAVAGMVVAPV